MSARSPRLSAAASSSFFLAIVLNLGCSEAPSQTPGTPPPAGPGAAGSPAIPAAGGGGSGPTGTAGMGPAPATGGSASTPPTGTAGAPPMSGGATGMPPQNPTAGASGSPPIGSGGMAGAGNAPSENPPPSLIGDVAFSTPSQTFRDQIQVQLTTAIAGAEIRYTTDGQLPTAASMAYAGTALTLTSTTELRAQAFVNGAATGAPSTALYIARTFDATSDLPIVIIDGYGKGKPTDKEVYFNAAVMIFEPVGGQASIAAMPTLASRGGYHVRGQSSASFPQTPYKVELWDNADKDVDHPVLGMPADSDWALIPPYYDRALIRNPFVYELGKEMGLEAPRTRFAEVYINYEARPLAETDYQGIYWFSETIKNNKVRTNLKQLDEKDTMLPAIAGGYIWKFDQLAAEEPKLECTGSNPISMGGFGQQGFGQQGGRQQQGGMQQGGMQMMPGTCWTDLEVVDPEPLLPEQEAWITSYIQTFHNSLHTTPIGDYAAYIDVPSFVDYFIINELTRNVDAYVRSAYFHKDRDGKIKAGPLWDYNFSLAVGGQGTVDPEGGWQYSGTRNVNNWYPKLMSDPAFVQQVKTRWAALRQDLLSQGALDQRITTLSAPLTNAIARDFAKWPVSSVIMPNGFVRGPTVTTWPEQIQAMRDYVSKRLVWMDGQMQTLGTAVAQ